MSGKYWVLNIVPQSHHSEDSQPSKSADRVYGYQHSDARPFRGVTHYDLPTVVTMPTRSNVRHVTLISSNHQHWNQEKSVTETDLTP